MIEAIEKASGGETILVEAGLYLMPRCVSIRADNVTLRGKTGDSRDVVIDGSKSRHGELISITACKGVTIADLTIQNIRWNGFKINSETNVQNLTIYNCIIHNIWRAYIPKSPTKQSPLPTSKKTSTIPPEAQNPTSAQTKWAAEFRLAMSLLLLL